MKMIFDMKTKRCVYCRFEVLLQVDLCLVGCVNTFNRKFRFSLAKLNTYDIISFILVSRLIVVIDIVILGLLYEGKTALIASCRDGLRWKNHWQI